MKYILNAFSANMLSEESSIVVDFKKIEPNRVEEDAVSCIGFANTAAIVSNLIGKTVEVNRASCALKKGDKAFIAQYQGPRLAEGTVELPEGSRMEFWKAEVVDETVQEFVGVDNCSIANAFSISMLQEDCKVCFEHCRKEDIPANVKSYVGHPDLANVLTKQLSANIEVNRTSYSFEEGHVLFIAQYKGPRLEPGTVELPKDSTIEFYRVYLIK